MSPREKVTNKKKVSAEGITKLKSQSKRKSLGNRPNSKKSKANKTRELQAITRDKPRDLSNGAAVDFFYHYFEPLLEKGRELLLYRWMLDCNLLKSPDQCLRAKCDGCEFLLKENLKNKDGIMWECAECKQNVSIRVGSLFKSMMCSIQVGLLAVKAYCDRVPMEEFAQSNDIKYVDLRRIYQVCLDVMDAFVKNPNGDINVLGGRDSVVLLDIWPNGYLRAPGYKHDSKLAWGSRLRVLWLADTNHVPVRYWSHVLPPLKTSVELRRINRDETFSEDRKTEFDNNDSICHPFGDHKNKLISKQNLQSKTDEKKRMPRRQSRENKTNGLSSDHKYRKGNGQSRGKKKMSVNSRSLKGSPRKRRRNKGTSNFKEIKQQEESDRFKDMLREVVKVVNLHVAPMSLILASEKALPGLCGALQSTGRYEAVMSVDQLLDVDCQGHRSTSDILDNIWQHADSVCKELTNSRRFTTHHKIVEFLWRRRFDTANSQTLYNMLSHIALYYCPQFGSNSQISSESEY